MCKSPNDIESKVEEYFYQIYDLCRKKGRGKEQKYNVAYLIKNDNLLSDIFKNDSSIDVADAYVKEFDKHFKSKSSMTYIGSTLEKIVERIPEPELVKYYYYGFKVPIGHIISVRKVLKEKYDQSRNSDVYFECPNCDDIIKFSQDKLHELEENSLNDVSEIVCKNCDCSFSIFFED